jgi:hypothetical protein
MKRACKNCKFFFKIPVGSDGLWDFTKEACAIKKLDYHLYKKTTCDSYSPKETNKENKMKEICHSCIHFDLNRLYCNKKRKSTWSANYCIQFETKKEKEIEKTCKSCKYFSGQGHYNGYCHRLLIDRNKNHYCSNYEQKENSMEETGNIWYVHNPFTGYTRHVHTSRGSAEDEAKRLAKENPGVLFQVLRRESTFISKPIEIRRYPDNEEDVEFPF